MELILKSESPEESAGLAEKILEACNPAKIFAIYGDLGAGKTTLVKALCRSLGAEDTVKSPTFSIVNEYHAGDTTIYHFDFYRIKNIQEAYDLGYEEYFYSGDYCFIEWPERIESLLPEESAVIRIEIAGLTQRTFKIAANN